MQKKVKFEKVT